MVIIKTPQQVAGIRQSCKLLAQIMEKLQKMVQVGVTTREINQVAEKMIADAGGVPAFKGYRNMPGVQPFPTALCASVNEVIVHGPAVSDMPLKEGDIIGLDLGINLQGYFSDMAVTVPVGNVAKRVQLLLDVTADSLNKGIKQIKPGNKIYDISQAIEETIIPHKFGIVRDFVGHGVGLAVHEDPRIPNYISQELSADLNIKLQVGMVLALEPMVTMGSERVDILNDGWSAVTHDNSYAAHFEHTVVVTETGYEVLTAL